MATRKQTRSRRIRAALIAAFIVVVTVAGFLAYRGLHGKSTTEVSYTTATVQRMTLTSSVSGTGNVELAEFVSVRPEVSGTVSGLAVQIGDQVEAGQLLFTIVNPELDLAVTRAEIAYQEAVLNLAKAELSVLQAKENLSELIEQYEAQSTTTTAFPATTVPASPTTTLPPTTVTTSPPPPATTTTSAPFTTTTLEPENPADTVPSSTISESGTVPSSTVSEQDTSAAAIHAASSSDAPSSTTGASASALGSASSAKITYLDIKAARQAVESAELAVSSAEVQVTSAQIALEQARKNAAKREVRAPLSGIVTELNVQNGDYVSASGSSSATQGSAAQGSATQGSSASSSSQGSTAQGSSSGAVMTITNPNAFTVTVSLPETDISSVKIGQKAAITFDALPDLTLTGKVTSIDLAGTNNQGIVSYGVVITPDITDPSIKAGMTVTVNIITQVAADVLAVPLAAVKSQGDAKYVQVLENGTPTPVTVEVGMTTDSYAEIASGLQEGQEVVVRTVTGQTSASTSTTWNRDSFLDGNGAGSLIPGAAPGAIPGATPGVMPSGVGPGSVAPGAR